MKKLLLVIWALNANAQIIWEKDVNLAFQKAKTLNKPVFIEAFHPTCPKCMALEPILKDINVGNYYNQNFINYKLDLSDTAKTKFLVSQNLSLTGFPMFLFFNNDKSFLHHEEPQTNAENLIKIGKNALIPEFASGNTKARFEAGIADFNNLLLLGQLTRMNQDSATNRKVSDAIFEIFPKEILGGIESYNITKKIVTRIDNGFAKYWFEHLPQAAAFEKADGHEGNERNSLGGMLQNELFRVDRKYMTLARVNLIKDYMKKLGLAEYVEGSTWMAEGAAYINENRGSEALALVETLCKKNLKNAPLLIYIIKYLNDSFTDLSHIALAKKYKANIAAVSKSSFKDQSEFHYEFARVAQFEKNKTEAQKEIDQAFLALKAAKITDIKRFETLKAEIAAMH